MTNPLSYPRKTPKGNIYEKPNYSIDVKRKLITGSASFTGFNFVHYLLQVKLEVRIINLDALTYAGSLENLKGLPDLERHALIRGDICNSAFVERLLEYYHINTNVHFAAETYIDCSFLRLELFIRINMVGEFGEGERRSASRRNPSSHVSIMRFQEFISMISRLSIST